MIILKRNLYPNKSRVHIWGGLGAQLTALIVTRFLQHIYVFRKFEIIIHQDDNFDFLISEGGNEIKLLADDINIKVNNDFLLPKNNRPRKYTLTELILKKFKSLKNSITILNKISSQKMIKLSEISNKKKNYFIDEVQIDCSIEFFINF